MRLYDTLSGQLHDFDSPNGQVRMYVCGITPYSSSHIGHAMSAVSFDVVRRYLEFRGFNVRHVQNFTDIDDKMIAAANERGIEVSDLAYSNIQEYIDAMGALNVAPAHEYPQGNAGDRQDRRDYPDPDRQGLCLRRRWRRLLPCKAR